MREHRIGGIPVVNANGKLVGIVTNRDLRFEKNMSRPITELMTSENLIVTQDGSDLSKAANLAGAPHREAACGGRRRPIGGPHHVP